jgi:hypothetical protein
MKKTVVSYFVEILDAKSKETSYLGLQGVIQDRPYFFARAGHVTTLLKYAINMFRLEMGDATVVEVRGVENGIKNSQATRLSVSEFFGRQVKKIKVPKHPKNSVFKIEYTTRSGVKHLSGGGPYGKTWLKAGDVRSHISYRLSYLKSSYSNARVIEIRMNDDKITTNHVVYHDLIEFYKQSPDCLKKYNAAFPESILDTKVTEERKL